MKYYILYNFFKNRKELILWNCLTINDDTEASICLKKIRLLTNNLTERSKCNAV